ncbi:hypothetical protein [Rubinisphaera italica]|uniref:Uncharacterized protein n=1 Tax=Rubinisphaera italica TaxID=2527969 RepID=A0A5C5XPM9_9PLAN|nr:hypothetical protein [Rubinisphaera italica]TWT64025.1 hypothetical protein Pan54_47850 [Rubinisphaera italica]
MRTTAAGFDRLSPVMACDPHPPIFFLSRITDRKLLFLGTLATLSVALSIALTITVHEQLIWKQQVSPRQQQFYWQRVGFVILTTVEVPMIELTSLSMIVLVWIFAGRKKH